MGCDLKKSMRKKMKSMCPPLSLLPRGKTALLPSLTKTDGTWLFDPPAAKKRLGRPKAAEEMLRKRG
jgi:hypothetical protein